MKFEDVVKQFLSEPGYAAFSVFTSDIDGCISEGITVPPGMISLWESDRDRLTLVRRPSTREYSWEPGVSVWPFKRTPLLDGSVIGIHHNNGNGSSSDSIKVVSWDGRTWRACNLGALQDVAKRSLLDRSAVDSGIVSPTAVPSAPTTFVKHSSDKPSPALFPPMALESIAAVLAFGAKKYAPGNWKNAPTWSVYGDAVLRHFFAFLRGEDTDPESGLPHLSHCACSLLFLLEFQLRKWSVDDRLSAPKEKP